MKTFSLQIKYSSRSLPYNETFTVEREDAELWDLRSSAVSSGVIVSDSGRVFNLRECEWFQINEFDAECSTSA